MSLSSSETTGFELLCQRIVLCVCVCVCLCSQVLTGSTSSLVCISPSIFFTKSHLFQACLVGFPEMHENANLHWLSLLFKISSVGHLITTFVLNT
ncbi:hypothetical protein F5B22DRAFT_227878 [Xylaria bambusicola]|uniref:uncharacterized protein n=1 Tax=Xylaria bambusicola TaxID=326684 RepID=UPI0020077C63|nr:uncharacterized protein F5B22DRAFT_227878 [Xylaria bambusicola]KAI0514687.1 hypothetical protein F5B22DRAFT_227878 [Xylaria bambusicola]